MQLQPQPIESASGASPQSDTPYSAEIRRTQSGIPHIKAADWGSLGYGYGYAQAEDNLCTLADAFVTYRGERSAWFGADARPPAGATFGQPRNIDADFFFRFIVDGAAVERYRSAQPATLQSLIEGFAAGYNRYLRDLDAGRFPNAHAACKGKPWVDRITSADVYQRLIAANLGGGSTQFLQQIANARPPRAPSASSDRRVERSRKNRRTSTSARRPASAAMRSRSARRSRTTTAASCSAIRTGSGAARTASIRRNSRFRAS